MDHYLFPEPHAVLEEAARRHADVWPFALEAIDLSHLAFDRQRELTAPFIPGVPNVRRARNEINDNCWRFFRSVAEPLVDSKAIREFHDSDGGEVVVMPDGLHVRLKKCTRSGVTSNVRTDKVKAMSHSAGRYLPYPGSTELDDFIRDGLWIDVAYVAGDSLAMYEQVGLKFANVKVSPSLVLEPLAPDQLHGIAPAASELVSDARGRLSG